MTPSANRKTAKGKVPDPNDVRLTLLVENQTGYRNLCRLITAGALGKPKGETSVTLAQVAAHAEGLHVTTGGDESPVARALSDGGLDAARSLLETLAGIFPGRLHVELQRHRLREEERRNVALVDLARQLRLPLVATNGVRYAAREGQGAPRRADVHPSPHDARRRRPPPRRPARAALQGRGRDGGALRRPSAKRSTRPWSFRNGSTSRSPTSATSSPTIRSRPARRPPRFCARSRGTARAPASGR